MSHSSGSSTISTWVGIGMTARSGCGTVDSMTNSDSLEVSSCRSRFTSRVSLQCRLVAVLSVMLRESIYGLHKLSGRL